MAILGSRCRFAETWLAAPQHNDKISTVRLSAIGELPVRQIGKEESFVATAFSCGRLSRWVYEVRTAMKSRKPLRYCLGVALLLPGCDAAQHARSDFARAVGAIAAATQSTPAPASAPARKADPRTSARPLDPPKQETVSNEPSSDVATATPVSLVGKSEAEVRSLLGPPTSEEDRAPGKTWHYRDGQCTVDVQLYPDVQTRQFGTLSYEVKSNDSTNEGKRLCIGQLKSRARANGG